MTGWTIENGKVEDELACPGVASLAPYESTQFSIDDLGYQVTHNGVDVFGQGVRTSFSVMDSKGNIVFSRTGAPVPEGEVASFGGIDFRDRATTDQTDTGVILELFNDVESKCLKVVYPKNESK